MNRIEQKFKELKKHNKKAFIVFITAGYPDLNTTKRLAIEFAKSGVDILELGVPFSDPLADGPVIQESSQVALENKINLNHILELVRQIRRYAAIPICLMTYYNPIFCFGEKRFIKQARVVGVDGVIIPDLPPEEARAFISRANKLELDTIFFLAPTSPPERMQLVSRLTRGFIYYISLTGVTGPRKKLPADMLRNLKIIKGFTSQPLCVGFGVSGPSQVVEIYRIADGVIVGSAIIKKIKENLGRKDLVERVVRFVSQLKNV